MAEIAGEIMAIRYAALAGTPMHAIGNPKNNNDLKTQYGNTIVRAANTIAYAEALARAATVAEQFRTHPIY